MKQNTFLVCLYELNLLIIGSLSDYRELILIRNRKKKVHLDICTKHIKIFIHNQVTVMQCNKYNFNAMNT